jgi:hypothetical protein
MLSMKKPSVSLPLTILIVGAAAVVVWSHLELGRKTSVQATEGKAWLPSYETVRLCSLGYDRFLADLFWLAFVQYAGDPEVTKIGKFDQAYQYADLVTQLDPQFSQPYWFGCWAIGFWQKRPDLADKILQRGISFNPGEWYMPYMAGINQYVFAKKPQAAAKYYAKAASLPGAPSFLARQAKILESGFPDQFEHVRMMTDLYESTTDHNLKEQVRQGLASFWSRVLKNPPTEEYRSRAKAALKKLGIEVE